MASFVILLTARTARIACSDATDGLTDRRTDGRTDGRAGGRADGRTGGRAGGRAGRQTDRQTDRQTGDNYCNRLCACAPRVNYTYDMSYRASNIIYYNRDFC